MRIAVMGPRGQLGAAMVAELAARHTVLAIDRQQLDITDAGRVADTLARVAPDAIINCTGYNAVDAAETHAVEALQINAFAVRSMARAARQIGATLVHVSSDFVFDGTSNRPWTEDDAPNPRSTYAASKLLGEWFAADAHAFVFRVESLFGVMPGAKDRGTVAGIVGIIAAGGTPKVIEDRTVSPTYIFDAAHAIRELLERRAAPGLYHLVNSGQCTWLEFAREAAALLGVTPTFEIVKFADMKLPAERPQYCVLSNRKLAGAGVEMPTWQDALARYVRARRT